MFKSLWSGGGDVVSDGESKTPTIYNVEDCDKADTFGGFFGGLSNNISNLTAKLQEGANHIVAKSNMLTDFSMMQAEFVKGKNTDRSSIGVAPWVGYHNEAALKEKILTLSQETRNFLMDPPPGTQFQFDFITFSPIANATLAEDIDLQQRRFELVPKVIPEENFWRNYFYRVSLIKQSSNLNAMKSTVGSRSSASGESNVSDSKISDLNNQKSKTTRRQQPHTEDSKSSIQMSNEDVVSSEDEELRDISDNDEFISDSLYEGVGALSHDSLQKELGQLGVGKGLSVTAVVDSLSTEDLDELVGTVDTSLPPEMLNGSLVDGMPTWERDLQDELDNMNVGSSDGAAVLSEGALSESSWETEIKDVLQEC